MAIAVKVPRRYASGTAGNGVADSSLEGAVTIAEQDTYRVRILIGHGQIGQAVAVEVSHHNRLRTVAGDVTLGVPEGAVALAHEHAHVGGVTIVITFVHHGDIEMAVVVKVPHRHRAGREAAGVVAL